MCACVRNLPWKISLYFQNSLSFLSSNLLIPSPTHTITFPSKLPPKSPLSNTSKVNSKSIPCLSLPAAVPCSLPSLSFSPPTRIDRGLSSKEPSPKRRKLQAPYILSALADTEQLQDIVNNYFLESSLAIITAFVGYNVNISFIKRIRAFREFHIQFASLCMIKLIYNL